VQFGVLLSRSCCVREDSNVKVPRYFQWEGGA
jgi:hypothetical protein